MSQRCNENTKPLDTQLMILKIYAFCWKFQQRVSGARDSTVGVTSVYEKTPGKLPHLPLKVAATLLNGSRKGTVGA